MQGTFLRLVGATLKPSAQPHSSRVFRAVMMMQSGITRIFTGIPPLTRRALFIRSQNLNSGSIMSRPFSAVTITICPLKKPSAGVRT